MSDFTSVSGNAVTYTVHPQNGLHIEVRVPRGKVELKALGTIGLNGTPSEIAAKLRVIADRIESARTVKL